MQSFLVSFWLRKSSDVPDLLYQKHHSSLCPANAFPVGLSPVLSAQKFSAGHMGDFSPPPLPLLFWFPSNNSVYNHKLSNSAICVSSKVWVWIGVFSLGLWTPCSKSDLHDKGELGAAGSSALIHSWTESSRYSHVKCLLCTSDSSFLSSALPERGDAYLFVLPFEEMVFFVVFFFNKQHDCI